MILAGAHMGVTNVLPSSVLSADIECVFGEDWIFLISKTFSKTIMLKLGMMAYTCHFSTWEAGEERLPLNVRPA